MDRFLDRSDRRSTPQSFWATYCRSGGNSPGQSNRVEINQVPCQLSSRKYNLCSTELGKKEVENL
jgi:hypothetical protein